METYSRIETILLATSNNDIISEVKNDVVKYNKKVYIAEPNSPDILAIPCFCIMGEMDFIGEKHLADFYELNKELTTRKTKTFLYLIDDMDIETILRNTHIAICKYMGCYCYSFQKKYRIMTHRVWISGRTSTPADIDNINDLKEIFELENVRSVDLGYYDILDNSPNNQISDIKVADFSGEHFEWLVTKSSGMSRFIEFNYKR